MVYGGGRVGCKLPQVPAKAFSRSGVLYGHQENQLGSQLKCLALRPGAPTLQREVHGQVLSASVFWAAPAWCIGPARVVHGQAVKRLS